jgi:hypothetical protein
MQQKAFYLGNVSAENLNDVRVAYNGESTLYYRKALQRNFDLLREMDARRASPRDFP